MAVVTTKSTAITNADAKPQVLSLPFISRGKLHQSIGYVAAANGDSIGSQYRLCRVRSGDRMSGVKVFNDAVTSGAANVGLYDTLANGGAVVSVSLFAAALSIATANKTGTDVLYSSIALASMEKRVWELLGLSADPGKEYDLVLTLTAATTAAGTVGAHVTSNSGE